MESMNVAHCLSLLYLRWTDDPIYSESQTILLGKSHSPYRSRKGAPFRLSASFSDMKVSALRLFDATSYAFVNIEKKGRLTSDVLTSNTAAAVTAGFLAGAFNCAMAYACGVSERS